MKYLFYKAVLSFAFVLPLVNFTFAQTDTQKGIELYKKGDYQTASKTLKQIVKKDSSDAQAWYYLGLSYLQQDKKKESEKALEKAVALDAKDTKIRVGLAYVYLLRNNSEDARKAARTVLASNPNEAEAYYILGVIDLRNDQYDAAYEKASQAAKIVPDFAAAHLLKSESLVSSLAIQPGKSGKTPEEKSVLFKNATESLEKYLSLSPDNEETKFQRQYLESLKFFAEYYSKPENQIPANPDADNQPADTGKTRVKFLAKPQAAYTNKAREARVSGTIRLLVGLESNGQVKHILITKRLGYGLDESAVRAAREIKFEPATKDGKPISSVVIIEYSFMTY